ncbi:MAG TPA: hypothetical protein VMF69_20735 [Gemmataceae bacterium]|nr:hypothetical protein [Gemmataceae bacterium]
MPAFRRLLLPPERLPEELKRVQDGVLVRLPSADFDALVERAAQAIKRKIAPRLLEARYHAMLKEESLFGEGQWKLVHTGPGPGLLSLQPFNLALRQTRFENGDALIASFDGDAPALLVETPGERTVSLDWSARGESSPEGLQFHLEMPPCPVAVLELDVPAGRGVTVLNDGALLSGPHEADIADLRRWKIVCGGRQRSDRQRVDIRIHSVERPAGVDSPPLPFVHQRTTQLLHPEGLDATFELTLDGLARGIRELVCECDAELRLRDVVGPGVDGCSFQAGDAKKPSRLTIRLREPVRAGTWKILCLAPLNRLLSSGGPKPIPWRSPGLRLVNSVPRGETLMLWLHPDLHIESWDSGSFRLSSSDLDRVTGLQVLTLVGGGLGPPRRPAAQLQAYSVEFSTQQLTWWRCDAAGMALTVQIGWDVKQGRLFQLPVQLPAGWNVEKVEMTPVPLLGDWHVRNTAGKTTLFVDLAGSLEPRPGNERERASEAAPRPASATRARLPVLTVHLRPGWSNPLVGQPILFPDVVPLGARFREGALALDCDEQLFHLQVRTSAERTEPESEGPWGQQLPEYYYRYRGQSVTGEIRVRARPPRLRAKCDSEIMVAAGQAVVETHLLLEAEAGSPSTIELLLSASDGGPWQWRNEVSPRGEEPAANRVRRAERVYSNEISFALQLLAASHPLQATIVQAVRPSGERWRLTLARPLRVREPLRLYARHRLQPRNNRWDVPLPVVLNADRMEGEVTLHLAGAGLAQMHSVGLRESASVADNGATPWRTFRYGQGEVGLTLSGEARPSDRSIVAAIECARLITYAGENGGLRHHFSFQVANWNEQSLPLRLPPGSRPLAVQVDGRWLPRLIPSETEMGGGASPAGRSQAEPGNKKTEPIELTLPVPNRADAVPGDSRHRFEVVYTRTLPVGILWQSLDAPAPQLPVAPLAFRRLWRLPPKLTPLHRERCQFLPGSAEEIELAALPRHPAGLFQFSGSWARFDPLLEDQQAGAREALDQAIQKLREQHADRKMSLREVVNDLAFIYLKDRYSLIIDELALREAHVGAETRLTIKRPSSEEAKQPWVECGLIALPARSAVLLTTNSGRGAIVHEPLSDELENALAAAAQCGQDSSGRFRSVLSWMYPDGSAIPASTWPRPLDFEYEGRDWSEWEPIAGLADERLIVVRCDGATALGLTLAVLFVLLFWLLLRCSVRHGRTLLLLALALFGLGVLWLPAALRDLAWWPLLAIGAVALLGYLRVIFGKTTASPQSTPRQSKNAASAAAVAGMLLLAFLGWNGRAAAPGPVTVYLVPASSDSPDKPTVLAPADLLARLKALARPTPLAPGGPQTVLLDAFYEGQLVDAGKQVEFAAVFSAYSLSDEPSTLSVPLAGVQLVGESLLDGARAAPLAAPQIGYSLAVRGRGRHKIELRFRVPVVGTVEDRNVLFTAPPLVHSRLAWHIPAGAVEPQVLVKNGAQWTMRDNDGQRLEADLGAPPLPVHLHWYQPSRPTRVSYRAAYLWDLGLEVNRLTAWLRYRVEQGAIKTLEVDLPAELEVSSATAQRTLPASRLSGRTRFQLRDWYVTRAGNKRVLHLDLPYPISGDFQVTLELLPHPPLTSPAALPLPALRGVRAGGPHYLAYRTQLGLHAQRETSQNLTRIDKTEFALDWLGGPTLEANFQGIAYRIPPNQPPQLFLRLEHRPPAIEGDVDVTVQTGAQRAEIEAVADVTAPNKDLAALEWELPPNCSIAAASGEDVRTWKQNGSRLLVWLNRTTAKTRIRLNGWLPLSSRDGQAHLDMNGPRLLHADKQHTHLRLAAAGDLVLAAVRTRSLHPPSAIDKSEKQVADSGQRTADFETWDSSYHLDCQVQTSANAIAHVLTLAEAADRELRFTTTVDYTVTHGELRQVRLRLRNWEEEKVEVQAERVALLPEPRRIMGERSWLLPLQPGVRGHYQVTLRGSMPLDKAAGGVPMPEVLVQGVERAEYLLVVAGNDLTGQAEGSLQALNSPSQALQPAWPSAAQRLERSGGQAWRIDGSEWQLRLLPRAQALQPTPVRVYLLEQWAAMVDGRRWMHEVRCWLRHEAHTDLAFAFPVPIRVLATAVDGVEMTPLSEIRNPRSDSDNSISDFGFRISDFKKRIWLSLSGRPGVRCIRLRWLYDQPEPLDRPNLTPPHLPGAVKGPTVWTVMVPPGWQAALTGTTGWQGATREAALALWRSDVQLLIRQDLAKESRDSVVSATSAAAQQRFALYCRHVRLALDLGADGSSAVGPRGQILRSWFAYLQIKDHSLNSENHSAANAAASSDLPGEAALAAELPGIADSGGTPLSWQTLPESEPLTLQLTLRENQRNRQALAASGQWLGVLLIAWILSALPFLWTRLRLFWPEQLALFGMFGWHRAGLTSIVLGLLLLAACGRVFLLIRGLRNLLRKRRQQSSAMTAGNGVVS